jgi:CRISPR-associated protein Cas2
MSSPRPLRQLPWGWRSMWVIAMFDLPVDTPKARKAYTRFRKTLLEDGFTMMQYSIYSRHCASIDNAEMHVRRMGDRVPSEGEVRFLTITDRQFGRIQVFAGKIRQPTAPSPSQMELF